MLDFRLKVFQSVAHHLSFTKASNELFISQPAITKHIKEIESEFNEKLFHRSGNKISLTHAGIILAQSVQNPFVKINKKLTHILLQVSVVGLGFGMNAWHALEAGKQGLLFTVFSIVSTITIGLLIGKKLKIENNLIPYRNRSYKRTSCKSRIQTLRSGVTALDIYFSVVLIGNN